MQETSWNERDLGLIPGLGPSPREENGNLLQYSCLGNPTDRGAWWTAYSPQGCKESDMTEWPNHHQWNRSGYLQADALFYFNEFSSEEFL